MRFGDRITADSLQELQTRQLAYWESLAAAGFTLSDPLYRFFGGDVFHDSRFAVRAVKLGQQTVELRLRNVFALDAVCAGLRAADDASRVDVADFRTRIRFGGVTKCRLAIAELRRCALYYSAEISRCEGLSSLEVALRDEYGGEGSFAIEFASLRIEDIAPKIAKYGACESNPKKDLLTWVVEEPGVHARRLSQELI